MTTTSASQTPDLTARLQNRMKERMTQAESLFDETLSSAEQRLKQRLSDAENSMLKDLSKLSETARITRYRLWLPPLIVGLSLTLGLTLGTVAGFKILSAMVTDRIQTLEQTEQPYGAWARRG